MTTSTEQDIRKEIRDAADRMARELTRRVADEPAVRATLRRGVGHRVEDPAMLPLHSFVIPYLGDLHERPRPSWTPTPGEAVERAFYAVATLIAAQPRQVRDRDAEHGPGSDGLGSALGTAVGKGLLNADTTEQRLHLLCRQSLDGVHIQLPRLMEHARKQGVDIAWGRLVLDLARWGGERDRVAKEWAQSFHRSVAAARRHSAENTSNDPDSPEAS